MAVKHPLHNVAIAGVYNTRQARVFEDETSASLTMDAVRGALADAGLKIDQVDGAAVSSGMGNEGTPQSYAYQLGGKPYWIGAHSTGIQGILAAAAAINNGLCHTVVMANGQAGTYSERAATAPWTRPANEFTQCWGLFTAAEFALIARRHMHLYGTKPEHLAEVAATIRNHGHRNPEAIYYGRGPFTREDILNSRMVADPFHILDCSMTSEGGMGMVLTTAERARDLPRPPVYLLGGSVELLGQSYTNPPRWDHTGYVGREGARRSFAMCGLGPRNIDVCVFYDPFSFEIIRQFEAFGFCGEGEGGPFVMDGRIGLAGEYPTVTDGGTMSFAHAGVAQLSQR